MLWREETCRRSSFSVFDSVVVLPNTGIVVVLMAH